MAKAWMVTSVDVVSSLEASFWYISCPAGYFAGENLPLLGLRQRRLWHHFILEGVERLSSSPLISRSCCLAMVVLQVPLWVVLGINVWGSAHIVVLVVQLLVGSLFFTKLA